MNSKGITLIELLLVISIIGILVIALGFSFVGWQGRYKVEKTTKDLYSDLMDARTRAMSRNATFLADFNTPAPPAGFGRYRIAEDTNGNSAINAGEPLPTFPKTVGYVINWDGGGTINFNNRGTITFPAMDPNNPCSTGGPGVISFTSTVNPDYDCICIEQTRIKMGLMNVPNPGCNEK